MLYLIAYKVDLKAMLKFSKYLETLPSVSQVVSIADQISRMNEAFVYQVYVYSLDSKKIHLVSDGLFNDFKPLNLFKFRIMGLIGIEPILAKQ